MERIQLLRRQADRQREAHLVPLDRQEADAVVPAPRVLAIQQERHVHMAGKLRALLPRPAGRQLQADLHLQPGERLPQRGQRQRSALERQQFVADERRVPLKLLRAGEHRRAAGQRHGRGQRQLRCGRRAGGSVERQPLDAQCGQRRRIRAGLAERAHVEERDFQRERLLAGQPRPDRQAEQDGKRPGGDGRVIARLVERDGICGVQNAEPEPLCRRAAERKGAVGHDHIVRRDICGALVGFHAQIGALGADEVRRVAREGTRDMERLPVIQQLLQRERQPLRPRLPRVVRRLRDHDGIACRVQRFDRVLDRGPRFARLSGRREVFARIDRRLQHAQDGGARGGDAHRHAEAQQQRGGRIGQRAQSGRHAAPLPRRRRSGFGSGGAEPLPEPVAAEQGLLEDIVVKFPFCHRVISPFGPLGLVVGRAPRPAGHGCPGAHETAGS